MSKRTLTFADRKRLRDEAIIDFKHGFINRREFMFRATALGISAAFAGKVANAVAAPAPQPTFNRWAKQADATITFIKGPHHPQDAQFWDEMKAAFEAANPGIALNPTFFNWATMDAELTAGYAAEPPDVIISSIWSSPSLSTLARWRTSPPASMRRTSPLKERRSRPLPGT
jgi:hypothetical protein